MIKGEDVANIVYGNTLGTGKAKDGFADGDGHPDEKFHYMLANPPFGVEWKPEKDHVTREHEELGFIGRFGPGLPRINDGALLFLMHMISKMHFSPEQGGEGSRIAIVFNGSTLFTGDAGGGESNIRRWIIENDMLDTVVGLPDQLFYNTGIYTYIWVVTNRKRQERKGKVQLINATEFAWKMKKSLNYKRKQIGDGEEGRPNHIDVLTKIYGEFKDNETKILSGINTNGDTNRDQNKEIIVSKVFNNRVFGYLKITVERPLRLNFAVTDERIEKFKDGTYFKTLAETQKRKDKASMAAEIAAGKQRQEEIIKVLEGMIPASASGELVKNRDLFEKQLNVAFKGSPVKLDNDLKKALLAPAA